MSDNKDHDSDSDAPEEFTQEQAKLEDAALRKIQRENKTRRKKSHCSFSAAAPSYFVPVGGFSPVKGVSLRFDLKRMGKRGAKKLTNTQGGPNLKSVLRHEHLKNLALWSSAGDTPIPSLASLFGRRLASDIEASGIATDPDLVSCQRCETILKPGFNCNVRIEKVSAKKKKRTRCKKANICLPQNNVVYHCNFCSHRNLKRGTAKGQMKELYPFKPKTPRSSRPKIIKEMTMPQDNQSNMLCSPERREKDQVEENGVENTPKPMMLTLERDKRIRKSKSKKPVEPESVVAEKTVGGSNKRKRKAWTSMKEIAETNKSSRTNLKIPFLL